MGIVWSSCSSRTRVVIEEEIGANDGYIGMEQHKRNVMMIGEGKTTKSDLERVVKNGCSMHAGKAPVSLVLRREEA